MAPKVAKIRYHLAYTPIIPPHVAQAPSWKLPSPPPGIPFFKERRHTVPTKWNLYRPLLRATYNRPEGLTRTSPKSKPSPTSPLTCSMSQPSEHTSQEPPSISAISPVPSQAKPVPQSISSSSSQTSPTDAALPNSFPTDLALSNPSTEADVRESDLEVNATTISSTPLSSLSFDPTPSRSSPSPNVDELHPGSSRSTQGLAALRNHIRSQWRRYKGLTSQRNTRAYLLTQESLLEHLQSPSPTVQSDIMQVNAHLQDRQERRIAETQAAASKPVPKAYIRGGYIYPTYFNPPLPRLIPQPPNISGMIRSRILSRNKRLARGKWFKDLKGDMRMEERMERDMGVVNSSLSGRIGGWDEEIDNVLNLFDQQYKRELARSRMVFSEETVEKVEAAKKASIRYRNQLGRERSRKSSEKDEQGHESRIITDKVEHEHDDVSRLE